MLQVEVIRAVPEGLQLGRNGPHDRHHETRFELAVNRPQAVEPEHHSSHIRSRWRRSATGCRLECASVWAWRIVLATKSGAARGRYGIPSARSTGSVTLPPCVCQGSRSPKEPRALTSIKSGIR